MSSAVISQFEVLAQPIAPVPNVPYVQQGFFVQVTNDGASAVKLDLTFAPCTPAFVAASPSGHVALFTNIVDLTGTATQYPTATFLSAPTGFKTIPVPPKSALIFGVQYFVAAGLATPPTDSVSARGLVEISATGGADIYVLATIRQLFGNYSTAGALLDVSEGAYTVPLVGGPQYKLR